MAQNKHNNQRKVFAMRTLAMTLFMVLFTQFAQAQRLTLKMTNGTREVPSGGFNFYDSGGPLLYTPGTPEADEYNWTTWYQHNESYTLILENPDGYGIEVEFEKLLINNDTLWFYEGEGINENNLIGSFCNNEYSSAFCSSSNKMKVVSHGNMTIRFKSDGRWRDEGWEAVVNNLTANDGSNPYAMQPPVAVMAACDEQMRLIPTCWDENPSQSGFQLQYRIGASGDFTNYAEGSWIDLNSQTFDLTVYTRTIANDPESTTTPPAIIASRTASYTFSEIKVPGHPGATQNVSSNTVTAFFPEKPNDVNDTYYIRWIINNNSNGSTENPNVWPVDGHEFQQPSNTSHEVPAGVIDYTNVTLGKPFYIHLATRGTTCPDLFSEVETVPVNMIYVPMPTITFVTNGNQGTTTLTCSLPGASIYYTTDGSEPDPTHVGGANDPTRLYEGTFSVLAGTTVKAIAVKTNYTNSAVASEIFIPGAENGNGQNGVYGNIVLLDDREDHSWSYDSDGDQPVHRLKPADVKISYKGYGEATMTDDSHTGDSGLGTDDFTEDVDAETVAVGPNDPGYEFIYLKTLENAKVDG